MSLALETGDDVACLLVASGYAEVMSWGKGHPEAMSSTSDLPTDLEQPPPPVGYLSPAPLTPREEVIVSVTFVSEGGVIHANLLQEGEWGCLCFTITGCSVSFLPPPVSPSRHAAAGPHRAGPADMPRPPQDVLCRRYSTRTSVLFIVQRGRYVLPC